MSVALLFAVFLALVCTAHQSAQQCLTTAGPGAVLTSEATHVDEASGADELSTMQLRQAQAAANKKALSMGDPQPSFRGIVTRWLPWFPGRAPSYMTRLLAAAAIMAAGVGSCAFLLCRLRPSNCKVEQLWQIYYCQMCCIGACGFVSVVFIAPITTAYDVTISLGSGAAASGLIIGAYYGLGWPALLVYSRVSQPWSQSRCLNLCLCCMVILGAAHLGFMVIATSLVPAASHGALPLTLLVLMRLVGGFAATIVQTLTKAMAQKVTPGADMVAFQLQYNSAILLGLALGPLVSSLTTVAFDARDPGSRMGYPSGLVSVIFFCFVPLMMCLIPTDLDAILRIKSSRDAEDDPGPAESRLAGAKAVESEWAQKQLWLAGAAYDFERTMSQVGVEVASSLVLELEMHWGPSTIGVIVSLAFLTGVPFNEVFFYAKRVLNLPEMTAARFCAIMGAVSTLLLWPGFGRRVVGSDVLFIMLAEVVMFPSLRITKSIMDAAVVQVSIPGTFYSAENYIFVQGMFCLSARVIAPPAVRWFVRSKGRFLYMFAQLGVNIFGCMTVFKATRAFQHL
mmetsp:Transcript_91585/g.258631  ORF Transcript_91585/g.258631 Transcript_91585/m.258631 type:complete len:567 (-) Transcript_91585:286-1986(-)